MCITTSISYSNPIKVEIIIGFTDEETEAWRSDGNTVSK